MAQDFVMQTVLWCGVKSCSIFGVDINSTSEDASPSAIIILLLSLKAN